MRLNKLIAQRLGDSRRAADKLIASGQATINGKIAEVGTDITDTKSVLINQKPLPKASEYLYVLFNKPVGYVCSRDGQGSKTIYDLLPKEFKHLNPVGRLDKNSSGLLLLTNDGNLHNRLTHPSNQKEKVYHITLNKPLTDKDKTTIESGGVLLTEGVSKFQITHKNTWLEIHMYEGRNRQIRRTFEVLNYKVITLNRIKFGNYMLGSLAPGDYKVIN